MLQATRSASPQGPPTVVLRRTEPEPDPRAELKRVCPFGQKNASICSTRFSVFYVARGKGVRRQECNTHISMPLPCFRNGSAEH